MKETERRIFVDEIICDNEYDYKFGEKKNVNVYFTFFNVKTDRDYKHSPMTYADALATARSKARDGRYKNYEFLINAL